MQDAVRQHHDERRLAQAGGTEVGLDEQGTLDAEPEPRRFREA